MKDGHMKGKFYFIARSAISYGEAVFHVVQAMVRFRINIGLEP